MAGSATSAHQNEDEKEIISTIDAWLSDTERTMIEAGTKNEAGSKRRTAQPKRSSKKAEGET
jgi:hypothetical protein